ELEFLSCVTLLAAPQSGGSGRRHLSADLLVVPPRVRVPVGWIRVVGKGIRIVARGVPVQRAVVVVPARWVVVRIAAVGVVRVVVRVVPVVLRRVDGRVGVTWRCQRAVGCRRSGYGGVRGGRLGLAA